MVAVSLCFGLLVFYLLVRILQVTSTAEKPKLFYKHPASLFVLSLLELCPILTSVYSPTSFWGKNGHFQTCVHAIMGRTKPRKPVSDRFHVIMPDGATMSYDVFGPKEKGKKARFTIAICPGIANTSECTYIRSFASHAQSHGYRVAVLNHLGSLKSEQLTSPRIFTYGGTDEYKTMIEKLHEDYPETKILAIGFSMGANIVTKYLGESQDNQHKVLCGVSICQGYEVNKAKDHFFEWTQLRRLYTYGMTLTQQSLLGRHRDKLFADTVKQSFKAIDEKKVFNATNLVDIDANYSCYRAGFTCLQDYYDWVSSAKCMQNILIPMLYLNAEDDPLIPPPLFCFPKETAEKNDNCIFMTTKHGGHLGFFEGGYFEPNELTWLDRFIVEYTDTIVTLYLQGKLPAIQKLSVCVPKSILSLKDRCDIDDKSDNATQTTYRKNRSKVKAFIDKETMKTSHVTLESTANEDDKRFEEDEKRDSLKRESIFKQATSFVQ